MEIQKKIVLNKRFGGFGLSLEAWNLLIELGYTPSENDMLLADSAENSAFRSYGYDIPRDSPLLVEVVERLGDRASGPLSELKVVSVTISIDINDYDGIETAVVSGGEW